MRPLGNHSSGTFVAERLSRSTRTAARRWACQTLLGVRGVPFLFDLAPGGACLANLVTELAVRSYRTLSPFPRTGSVGRFTFCGAFPGVSPAGYYPAPYLRGARTFLHRPKPTAITQPSDVNARITRISSRRRDCKYYFVKLSLNTKCYFSVPLRFIF